ncbi:hypothetical protein RCO28_20670 [Streptomyces sp. LHD-70]|uniref:hypothetical protein n=1 Tax=Streptomyces sp. LHD-70 TaxID=3072140 RepID=UPI00280D280B|nr:hypothetical protein [Streptomyces sp. LHD-70]MDQ8704887.1 hypothetical protein [Streptomyces sp. LHD-70]
MSEFVAEAAAATATAANRAPVAREFDGRGFVPVRADHLFHLIKTVEQHGRMLTEIRDQLAQLAPTHADPTPADSN